MEILLKTKKKNDNKISLNELINYTSKGLMNGFPKIIKYKIIHYKSLKTR